MMYNINPFQMIQMIKSGGNPAEVFQNIARINPDFKRIMGAVNGKSPQELKQYAENLAQERGVNLEDMANKLGINLPK